MTNIFIIVALLVVFFVVIQKYVIRHDDTKDYAYKRKGRCSIWPKAPFITH